MKFEKQRATLELKDVEDAIVLYMREIHKTRIDPKSISFVFTEQNMPGDWHAREPTMTILNGAFVEVE